MTQSTDPVRLERLEKALGRMPRGHREIIILARVEGLTYAEIGWRLGLTIEQVERRMADAIFALDVALHRQQLHWWRFW